MFNMRKLLVFDDFVHRDSISVEVVKGFFQSFRFAVVMCVCSAIVFGVAAFDVATGVRGVSRTGGVFLPLSR